MSKVTYKTSRKKQIQMAVVFVIMYFVIILSFVAQGGDKIITLWAMGGFAILLGGLLLFYVRKRAKEVRCPFCEKDLFEIIDVPRNEKSEFKYCPFCGNKIELE